MPTQLPRGRSIAAACAVAFAIATVTACGDDDQTTTAADNPAGTTTAAAGGADSSGSGAEPATDEGQIRALVARVQEAFKTGDGPIVCDSLTTAGQRDVVAYGRTMQTPGTCTEVVAAIARQTEESNLEQPPVRVVAVRVSGTKATALMKIAGTAPLRQSYDKVDGEWKVRSFGIGAAVDTQSGG